MYGYYIHITTYPYIIVIIFCSSINIICVKFEDVFCMFLASLRLAKTWPNFMYRVSHSDIIYIGFPGAFENY